MALKAILDKESLHRVEQGSTLVAVKGSMVLEDDELGSRRMRFQMTGDDLVAWSTAPNANARKGLLRAYVQKKIAKTMKVWAQDPPIKRGVPMDDTEFGGDL